MTTGKGGASTLDVRLLYLALAVVGVVAVGLLAMTLARQQAAERAAAEATPTVEGTANPLVYEMEGGKRVDVSGLGVTIDNQPAIKMVVKGVPPVALEDAPVGPSEPRVWIDGLTEDFKYDMGDVVAQAATDADIVVRNIGTGPLEIAEVGGSCGCTAVIVDDTSVPPGGETTLRVSYDPRVNQDFGRAIEKLIHVKSNDPIVPTAQFTLKAFVKKQ